MVKTSFYSFLKFHNHLIGCIENVDFGAYFTNKLSRNC